MTIEYEVIPIQYERKLYYLFSQFPLLAKDKELQNEILQWAKNMLTECRTEWNNMHSLTIKSIISCDRKAEAQKRAAARDKKYSLFRQQFKQTQLKKWLSYHKSGKHLSANAFLLWFMKHKAETVDIPYKKSNLENKLLQLAQANNREFKKAFACYS